MIFVSNVTISFTVNFVNVSSASDGITTASEEFRKHVSYDTENNITFLNLSSGDSANLTLMITTLDNATFQDTKFDLKVKSRTEDVYTSTFHLYNRDKQ